MQLNTRVLAIALCVLAITASVSPARAHDFSSPNSGAVPRTSEFEKAIGAERFGSESWAKLYSFVQTQQIWRGTPRLNVCFWDTETRYDRRKEQIARIADELTVSLPVKFVWRTAGKFTVCTTTLSDFEVRISLSGKGALVAQSIDDPTTFFAVIGRAGKTSTIRKATVNLPFDSVDSEAFARPRILHEFCHVLGCLHEHQRAACNFNEDEIKARFNLTPVQFEADYARRDSSVNARAFGPFDKDSVMLYRTHAWMFKDKPEDSPCYRPHEVENLSPADKLGIAAAYEPSDQKMGGMSLDDLLGRKKELLGGAEEKRKQAGMLREKLGQYSHNKNSTEAAGKLGGLDLAMRSLLLDFAADDLEREAAAWDFSPEAIEHLRLAFALPE